MDVHITQPDLEARLTQSAAQQGRHPDELVQEVLTNYFEAERHDYWEAVEGAREGYADLQAGRVDPAQSVFDELRVKHGFSR